MTPLYPQKLALTSPTGGGLSVGIVRSRTKATEFSSISDIIYCLRPHLHITKVSDGWQLVRVELHIKYIIVIVNLFTGSRGCKVGMVLYWVSNE